MFTFIGRTGIKYGTYDTLKEATLALGLRSGEGTSSEYVQAWLAAKPGRTVTGVAVAPIALKGEALTISPGDVVNGSSGARRVVIDVIDDSRYLGFNLDTEEVGTHRRRFLVGVE